MRLVDRRSPWLVALTLFAVLALAAGACASGSNDAMAISRSDASDTTAPPAATTTTAAAFGGSGASFPGSQAFAADGASSRDQLSGTISTDQSALGDGGIAPVVFQTGDFGRDIIRTADITVAVTDVAAAGDAATREIAALGGFLFGQRTTGSPDPVSVLTFKVLPEDFSEALDRLGSIGEVRSQVVLTDDVTERIVDLESRILTAEASVVRLRELLSSAGGVAVVVQVETELLQRETQLETLRGQLRTLEDQVGLATIVVTLSEAVTRPALDLIVTAYPGHDGHGKSCPGDFGLSIEEGREATVCFEILNAGDTPLTEFELNDPVLDVTLEDLTVVVGETAEALEPGDSIILATEIAPDRDLRTQTRVSATPLNQDGGPLEGRTLANTATVFIDTVDPGGVPGFTEGFSASLAFLSDLGRVVILGAGVLLPFLWLPPILAWLFLRLRRRGRTLIPEEDDPALSPG